MTSKFWKNSDFFLLKTYSWLLDGLYSNIILNNMFYTIKNKLVND